MSKSHLLPSFDAEKEREIINDWIFKIESNLKECLAAKMPSFAWLQNIEEMQALDYKIPIPFLLKIGKN